MNKAIVANNLQKKFGENYALRNVNFSADQGEVIVIIGPSGGGKSTLLRSLMRLEKIDAGEIYLGEACLVKTNAAGEAEYMPKKDWRKEQLKMGMVFQNYPLFPHLTILENLLLAPLSLKIFSQRKSKQIAIELLASIGLAGREKAYPCELSGGQKQRASIARALVLQPEIIIFDEPTSALDPELVNSIIETIKVLAIEKNKTVIITTHQLNFAAEIADKIVFMDQGEIIESGDPKEILGNPQSKRLRNFLKNATAVGNRLVGC